MMQRTPILVYLALIALLSCRADEIPSRALSLARGQSVTILRSKLPIGSGLLLSKKQILTCAHVTPARPDDSGETIYQVALSDGTTKDAHLSQTSAQIDLAILEGEFGSVETLSTDSWIAREKLNEGQRIFLYGAPYGLSNSLMQGNISQNNRIQTDPGFAEIPFIQTQGVSFPGTSGSGVYTWDGLLIGINRAAYGTNHSGIGLVIPSGFVLQFLKTSARAFLI
ncbi:MAG: serine protease [Spirochaetia bacterium]|nr:serine protease [Spirochaetia bacterium]